MTIAVDWDVKHQTKQTNKQTRFGVFFFQGILKHVHRGSYMSAHVLFYLLKGFGKSDKI